MKKLLHLFCYMVLLYISTMGFPLFVNAADISRDRQLTEQDELKEKKQVLKSPVVRKSMDVEETTDLKPKKKQVLKSPVVRKSMDVEETTDLKPKEEKESMNIVKTLEKLKIVRGKIEQDIDNLKVEGAKLSPEAKAAFIKQIILSESSKGKTADEISLPQAEASELLSAMGAKAKGKTITPAIVKDTTTQWIIQKVKPDIPNLIAKNAAIEGIKIDKEANILLNKALLENTEGLAKSGVSPEIIKIQNDGYLKALLAPISSTKLTEKEYNKAKKSIFRRLVRLSIKSEPSGADVEVAGVLIGKTVIIKKPFEAGKEYVFLFRLRGYKPSLRSFYVAPDPPEQELIEILLPESI